MTVMTSMHSRPDVEVNNHLGISNNHWRFFFSKPIALFCNALVWLFTILAQKAMSPPFLYYLKQHYYLLYLQLWPRQMETSIQLWYGFCPSKKKEKKKIYIHGSPYLAGTKYTKHFFKKISDNFFTNFNKFFQTLTFFHKQVNLFTTNKIHTTSHKKNFNRKIFCLFKQGSISINFIGNSIDHMLHNFVLFIFFINLLVISKKNKKQKNSKDNW